MNIKLVHILLDPNDSQDISKENWDSVVAKQKVSRDYWESVKHKFTSYIPRYSVVNRTELPSENCAQPQILRPEKNFVAGNGPGLSYGHYGCYKSNKLGILENFTEDVDILMLIGGDVVTDMSADELYEKVMEGYYVAKSCDARMVNFDNPIYMSGGNWWEMSVDIGNWVKVPHFMIGNIILILKSERENIIEKLKTDGRSGWHSFDIWLAWNYHNTVPLLTSKHPLAYQVEGFSVLDNNNDNLNVKKW
jgi:hypothetical protein